MRGIILRLMRMLYLFVCLREALCLLWRPTLTGTLEERTAFIKGTEGLHFHVKLT